eukprot:g4672.t1
MATRGSSNVDGATKKREEEDIEVKKDGNVVCHHWKFKGHCGACVVDGASEGHGVNNEGGNDKGHSTTETPKKDLIRGVGSKNSSFSALLQRRESIEMEHDVIQYLEGAFMMRENVLLHHVWHPRFFRIALDMGTMSHVSIDSITDRVSSTEFNWSSPIDLWQSNVTIDPIDKSSLLSDDHQYSWSLSLEGKIYVTASARSELERDDWIDAVRKIIATQKRDDNYDTILKFQQQMKGNKVSRMAALKILTERTNAFIKETVDKSGGGFTSQTRNDVKDFLCKSFGTDAYETFKPQIRSLFQAWVGRTTTPLRNAPKQGKKKSSEKMCGRHSPFDRKKKNNDSTIGNGSGNSSNCDECDVRDDAGGDDAHKVADDVDGGGGGNRDSCDEEMMSLTVPPVLDWTEDLISNDVENLQLNEVKGRIIEKFGAEEFEMYKWEIMFIHAAHPPDVSVVLRRGVIRSLLDYVRLRVGKENQNTNRLNWRSIRTLLLETHTKDDVSKCKQWIRIFLATLTMNQEYIFMSKTQSASLKTKSRRRRCAGACKRCLQSQIVGIDIKYINLLRFAAIAPVALAVLYYVPPLKLWMMPLYLLYVLPFVPFLPTIIGWLLTKILFLTAMNGHPLIFGSVHLTPWIRKDHEGKTAIHLRVVVEDAAFGNPTPDYPHPFFVGCKRVDFEFSIPIETLWNLRRFKETGWSPFPNEVMQNLRVRKRRQRELEAKKKELNREPHHSSSSKSVRATANIIAGKIRSKTSQWGMSVASKASLGHARDLSNDSTTSTKSSSSDSHDDFGGGRRPSYDGKHLSGHLYDSSDEDEASEDFVAIKTCKEIVLVDSARDDESGSWRKMHTRMFHLHPYAPDNATYESLGHSNGNDATPTQCSGRRLIPACRRLDASNDVGVQRRRRIRKNVSWDRVWDDSSDDRSTPTCSIWMPVAPPGFVALGVVCLNGPAANSQPTFEVMCVDAAMTTKVSTTNYVKGWSDVGSGATASIKLRVLPHGLLWPVSYPSWFRLPSYGARTIPEVAEVRAEFGYEEAKAWVAEEEKRSRDAMLKAMFGERPTYLGNATFHHIHFEGVQLNFEMYKREFNINGVTRVIAEGECRDHIRRHAKMHIGSGSSNNMLRSMRRAWWPNELIIKIKSAKNLPLRGPRSPGKYFARATIRNLVDAPETGCNPNRSPKWSGQPWYIHVLDPSAVLHIQVFDSRKLGNKLVGQWITTLKWLYINPRYNWHESIDVKVGREGVSISGDFILQDSKWNGALGKRGMYGQSAVCDPERNRGTINMEIAWVHNPDKRKTYLPPDLSAMDQLKMNSAETSLRLGNLDNVIAMVRRFPLKFNVRYVRLTDVNFFLKDLFSGKSGAAEDGEEMKSIYIPEIVVDKELHPSTKDGGGIPLYDMLERFFLKGVSHRVLGNYMVYYRGLASIFGGVFNSIFKGKSTSRTSEIKGKFTALRKYNFFGELGLSKSEKKEKYVTADDPDIDKPKLFEGYLEKCSRSKRYQFRNWKLYLFMLRGSTLFYQRVDYKTGNPSQEIKKLVLSRHQMVAFKAKEGEIFIVEENNDRYLRFPRIRGEVPKIMQSKMPTIEEWYRIVQRHRHRDFPDADSILVRLDRATDLPSLANSFMSSLSLTEGIDPYCVIRIIDPDNDGKDALPSRVSATKSSRNPSWKEEFAMGPVDIQRHFLVIEVKSGEDYVGEVMYPLIQLRKSEEQAFITPLMDPDGRSYVKVQGLVHFKARICRPVYRSAGVRK